MDHWESQLRKGVVDLAVLSAVACGETYGYRVVEQLAGLAGLELTESTVYPALTRLAREGWLAVRSQPSPSGPPRRYYRLTDAGQQHLRRMTERWRTLATSLAKLTEGAAG